MGPSLYRGSAKKLGLACQVPMFSWKHCCLQDDAQKLVDAKGSTSPEYLLEK